MFRAAVICRSVDFENKFEVDKKNVKGKNRCNLVWKLVLRKSGPERERERERE
jgi:hypothetical protein